MSIPTFEDLRKDARSLESLAAFRQVDFTFSGVGDPRNVSGVRATAELFSVLRSSAEIGRTFTKEESQFGAESVVVISHGFWTRVLGGDRNIVGRAILLDAVPVTVVGVMPASFEFPTCSNVRGSNRQRQLVRRWYV